MQCMTQHKTLFLIDGHAIAYRAFYGMQARRFQTRQGLPTGAIFGFARILFDLIRSYKPELLAVCFDTKDPTHRHEAYDNYKGHRKPPPDDLILQFPYMQQLVKALGMPLHQLSGYEADDLIGTLAVAAAEAGYDVRVVTGDRDLFQLINERIHILLPTKDNSGRFDDFGAEEVYQKYGYRPEQVVDFKALAGDASDNIPGVRGIGEKSALELLRVHGSLEAIYAAVAAKADSVPGKWRSKLETGHDDALLSQKLARILLDAPVHFDAEASHLGELKLAELMSLLKELEFQSIERELPELLRYFRNSDADLLALADTPPVTERPLLRPDVNIPASLADVKALLPQLQAGFAFDTETSGLIPLDTDLIGLSLAAEVEGEVKSWYLPFGHQLPEDAPQQLPLAETLALLQPIFADPDCPKCAHNAKFDMHVLSLHGLTIKGLRDDTLLLDYLLEPDSRHGLKELAWSHLGLEMQPISDLIGTGRKQITMAEVPMQQAAVYAAADAVATWMLQQKLTPLLAEAGCESLYREIEMPLLSVLARMEQNGIALDLPFLAELSQQLDVQLRQLEAEVMQVAETPFNLNSPQQLSKVLFEDLNLPSKGIKKNKTGAYSTDVKTLEKLRPFHPVIDQILEYRQLAKLKSTYVDAMPQLVNRHTGRLHTTFNQLGAITGRLSSTEPNLQNIPVRTELGRQMRKAFVASSPELRLVSLDYSQIELRLLAHFSEDPRFVEAFQADRDIHAQTAMELFNLSDIALVSSEMRRIAKTTNFGIVYGQSAYGLAQTLGISNGEASKIIQRFKERYSGIEAYMQQTLDFARSHGYVETLSGRRRLLPEINNPNRMTRELNERMAINSPLQGSASDLIKQAMIEIQAWIAAEQLSARLLLQVHDELLFEIPAADLDAIVPGIQQRMEQVVPLRVPLKVDVHSGLNWMEAK